MMAPERSYLVTVHIVVGADTRVIAQALIKNVFHGRSSIRNIRKVTYVGLPIMLKDDKPQAVEVHRDLPTQVFSLRRMWAKEVNEDAMRMEDRENAEYRASVEQYEESSVEQYEEYYLKPLRELLESDEDSINPNEADMGTTKRD